MNMAGQQQGIDPVALNLAQRNAVLANSVLMVQQIDAVSVNPANNPIINIPTRNVGLIIGFLVEVEGIAKNGAADAATRTGFGSANIVKNFTFTDLNNVQRINTTGYHLALLNAARQGFPFGAAYAPNLPMAWGNNWTPFKGAANLAAAASGNVKHTYHVPLAYAKNDLRGGIYANVVNATMNMQISLNTNPFVGAGVDPLNAVYAGNANGAWDGNISIKVYQIYYDQIPMDQNRNPIIPFDDMSIIYDLKQTAVPSPVQGQDFPIPYANYRQFLSTFAIFDNAGVFNTGSDVNYWAMVAANQSQLFRVGPDIAALQARQTFMADCPPGTYYFDHRDRPIDTITYGNMELVLNASAVTAGAQVVLGYEAFSRQGAMGLASSLAAGVN